MKILKYFKEFQKINENVQVAKKILTSKGLNEDNPEYKKILKLLKNNRNYIGQFTDFHFNQNISINDLNNLLNFIKSPDSKKLPKPPIEYKSYEELIDDINKIKNEKIVKKFINELPSNLKKRVKMNINEEFKELAIKLYNLPNSKGFFKNISKIKSYIELIKYMKDFIEKGEIDYYNLLNELKNIDGVEIVYKNDKDGIIIIKVLDYRASKKLGSTNWCISNSFSMFSNYVYNPKCNQYFIWNFNTDEDRYKLIGITIDEKGEVYAAYDFNNNDISKNLPDYVNKLFKYLKAPNKEDLKKIKYYIKKNKDIEYEEMKERERRRIAQLIEDNQIRRENKEWDNDPIIKAMIKHLDINLDELKEEGKDIYDVLFEIGHYYHLREFEYLYDKSTYAAGYEIDMYKSLKEYLESLIDDVGLLYLNDIEYYLNKEELVRDYLLDEDYYREH